MENTKEQLLGITSSVSTQIILPRFIDRSESKLDEDGEMFERTFYLLQHNRKVTKHPNKHKSKDNDTLELHSGSVLLVNV